MMTMTMGRRRDRSDRLVELREIPKGKRRAQPLRRSRSHSNGQTDNSESSDIDIDITRLSHLIALAALRLTVRTQRCRASDASAALRLQPPARRSLNAAAAPWPLSLSAAASSPGFKSPHSQPASTE